MNTRTQDRTPQRPAGQADRRRTGTRAQPQSPEPYMNLYISRGGIHFALQGAAYRAGSHLLTGALGASLVHIVALTLR